MANETVSQSVSETAKDIKALIREAERALAEVGDDADVSVQELRNKMRLFLGETATVYENAKDRAQEQLSRADDYVRSNPYQAVGVAALLGLLVGAIISRPSRY